MIIQPALTPLQLSRRMRLLYGQLLFWTSTSKTAAPEATNEQFDKVQVEGVTLTMPLHQKPTAASCTHTLLRPVMESTPWSKKRVRSRCLWFRRAAAPVERLVEENHTDGGVDPGRRGAVQSGLCSTSDNDNNAHQPASASPGGNRTLNTRRSIDRAARWRAAGSSPPNGPSAATHLAILPRRTG